MRFSSPSSGVRMSRGPSLRSFSIARVGDLNRVSAVLGPILALTIAGVLSGCKPVGPNYKRPAYTAPEAYKETGAPTVVPPPNPAGGSWNPANPSDGLLRGKWWEVFGDPQLNKLEDRTAMENQALQQAMHNYLAARDQVAVVRSTLFPTLSASAGFTHSQSSRNRPLATSAGKLSYNDLILGGQAAWEPDLWGRVRRSVESARANAQARPRRWPTSTFRCRPNWPRTISTARSRLADQAPEINGGRPLERQLDLTQRRLKGGVATAADVEQAGTQLETVRARWWT